MTNGSPVATIVSPALKHQARDNVASGAFLTGATILSEQIAKLTALEAHPQTGANTNTISYREDVDD